MLDLFSDFNGYFKITFAIKWISCRQYFIFEVGSSANMVYLCYTTLFYSMGKLGRFYYIYKAKIAST